MAPAFAGIQNFEDIDSCLHRNDMFFFILYPDESGCRFAPFLGFFENIPQSFGIDFLACEQNKLLGGLVDEHIHSASDSQHTAYPHPTLQATSAPPSIQTQARCRYGYTSDNLEQQKDNAKLLSQPLTYSRKSKAAHFQPLAPSRKSKSLN